MISAKDSAHLNESNDDYADLYFDITRGGGLNYDVESGNEILEKKANLTENTIKIKREQDYSDTNFQNGLTLNERKDFMACSGSEGANELKESNIFGNSVKQERTIRDISLFSQKSAKTNSNECGKGFSRSNFQCNIKNFKEKGNQLQNIDNNQNGEGIKRLSKKQKPVKHIIGSKPKFQCDECGKFLASKGSLGNHKKIHAGIKEFKCEECDKCFFQKGNMVKHQNMVHRVIRI